MLVLGLFNISEILQEIASALALNIESYLKLHMLMPLLAHKSADKVALDCLSEGTHTYIWGWN